MKPKNIQNTIDELMDKHSIKTYVELLIKIGKELGVDNVYIFAEKEKSNFTKMLKGERLLKHEFIMPLEKIFGVPMAKLLDEEEYKINFSKEDLPYIKGFSYFTYFDDPTLIEKEFDKSMITIDGDSAIANYDEFNMNILEYIVKYNAINTLRHLVNRYGLKSFIINSDNYELKDQYNQLLTTRTKKSLDYLIVENDLVDVFEKFYDPYYVLMVNKYINKNSIFMDEKFIELIINSNNIFNHLFEIKNYTFGYFNEGMVADKNKLNEVIAVINPLLNTCLEYALNNIDKYKDKAKRIIEFGIEYNNIALKNTGENEDDLKVREYGNVCYQNGHEFITNIVYSNARTNDNEINTLLNQLATIEYIGK